MSHVVDASNIVSLISSTQAYSKTYNLFKTDYISYQLNYSGTTQNAAIMASASNVTAAVQATMGITVLDYTKLANGDTITINGTVYVAGTDFAIITSNSAVATSIAALTPTGITGSASMAVATFTNTAYGTVGNANTVSFNTATSGALSISTAWSGGIDCLFTKTAHGLIAGLEGQMTTSNALPTGLLTSTNYFVIVLSANTFALASSLANANAGTRIQFTSTGTGNQTFTPVTISQVVKLQQSNDNVTYFDVSGVTVTISSATAASTLWLVTNPPTLWHKIVVTPTSGALNLAVVVCNRNSSIVGGA